MDVNQKNLSDLLFRMNEQLSQNGAVVTPTAPDGKKEERCHACVMDCFMSSHNAKVMHAANGADCERCIQSFVRTEGDNLFTDGSDMLTV
jgi:hypothetical protein